MLDRRRFLRTLAVATSAGTLAACGVRPGRQVPQSLDEHVSELTRRIDPDQRYRGATDAERDRAVAAVEQLMVGDVDVAEKEFETLGFSLQRLRDAPSQRDCVVATAEVDSARAWGLLVITPGTGAPDVLIEVPHPRADRFTEKIGLALFRAVPGSALLIAGAHRDAAQGAADVAHRSDSLFAALAVEIAQRGSCELQLHGFADDSLRGKDVVISTGRARVGPCAQRLAESLGDTGLVVCRAWSQDCDPLEGMENEQGRAAALHRRAFIHLELNYTTRRSSAQRGAVVAALARVLNDLG